MKYQIRITYPNGLIAYLAHRDKSAWIKRTAQKHMSEFAQVFGLPCELEAA